MDVLVVALERDETGVTQNGDTTLESGDRVRLFSTRSVPTDTTRAFGAQDRQ